MYYYYLSVDSEVPLLRPTRKKRRLRRLLVYQHQGVSLARLRLGEASFILALFFSYACS